MKNLRLKSIRNVLGAVIVALLALHIVGVTLLLYTPVKTLAVISVLDLDTEQSIGTWVTVLLLGALSVLAYLLYRGAPQTAKRERICWGILSATFLYLSLDEATSLHEHLIDPVQQSLRISSGPLFFAWVVPALILVALFSILMFRFFRALPAHVQKKLFTAFIVYLLGALGVEMIAGAYWSAQLFSRDLTYRLLNGLEEGLELTGIVIALVALLSHAAEQNIVQRLSKSEK